MYTAIPAQNFLTTAHRKPKYHRTSYIYQDNLRTIPHTAKDAGKSHSLSFSRSIQFIYRIQLYHALNPLCPQYYTKKHAFKSRINSYPVHRLIIIGILLAIYRFRHKNNFLELPLSNPDIPMKSKTSTPHHFRLLCRQPGFSCNKRTENA